MNANATRILTVFRKELADVLRDRRTLIATIVVPVVLYPLLMLLSLQAVSIETAQVAQETIVVGVRDEAARAHLNALLDEAAEALPPSPREGQGEGAPGVDTAPHRAEPGELAGETANGDEAQQQAPSPQPSPGGRGGQAAQPPEPLRDHVETIVTDDLRSAVLNRVIQVGVVFGDRTDEQVHVELLFQPESLRSASAAGRVRDMLGRVARARLTDRLDRLGITRETITPVVVEQTTLSTPGSLLSLILPLVLVLMTITSAIYPAIDLTAGEHERGTLETLVVCPVPILDLVVGKFLCIATIALLGATLNLVSVTATVYFGGLGELLGAAGDGASAASGGGGFPWWAIPVILLSLVPFTVLMSAVLIVVCSFARSFKEAQNYMTPVIIAVLLPALVASLPGARLEGLMLVLPVGNMVLLVREVLSGVPVGAAAFGWAIGSTTLYAVAAVVLAAQVFGREAVLFADSVSMRTLLSHKSAKPRRLPPLTMAALYAAVLFPIWFYLQTFMQQAAGGDLATLLRYTAVAMPLLFVAVPALMLGHWKIDLRGAWSLAAPRPRDLASAVLLGLSMWTVAHELFVAQQAVLPTPPQLMESNDALVAALRSQPLWLTLLLIAIIPAICEELFFRGFVMNGLRTATRKWTAIVLAAAAFAMFHFFLFKFSTTFVLGVALGWLCWQSASIWPAIVAHALHNGLAALSARHPRWQTSLGIDPADPFAHLPWPVLLGAAVLLTAAVLLSRKRRERVSGPPAR